MDQAAWQAKGAGHRQRLRERFRNRGLEGFEDSEVIELLLTLGTPRRDCKEPARALLERFGSLAAVLEAGPDQLQTVKGVGPVNCFAIPLIHGVARRYLTQRLPSKQYLRSSREVAEYLIHSMRDLKQEVLTAIFLDAQHAIITSEVLSRGTITANTVYPRELIARALAHHAAAVVIAHNHPSGSLQPSPQDRKLTSQLYLACALMHIRLLDHLIVGGAETVYSFADHGLMEEIREECAARL